MAKRFGALRRGAIIRSLVVAGTIIGTTLAGVGISEAAKNAAIVVDAKSGKVLYSSGADTQTPPASLTKMMTMYMLFDAIQSGRVSMGSPITMSKTAAAKPPTKLGLKPGQTLTVQEAILAMVTLSANDVAAAVGEFLGGSEAGFAAQMTRTARAMGMSRTTFRTASGLPAPGQLTTARDMALLGRALQDRFPNEFKYFSTTRFNFRGRVIRSHNRLLGRVPGVNGIKTGYTRASGYNLVTSYDKGGRKVVAVVLGGATGRARDNRMAALLDDYIPKATAGVRTASLVGRPGTQGAIAEIDEPIALVPVPRSKPDDAPVETGSIVAAAAPAPVIDEAPAEEIAAAAEVASVTPVVDEGDGGDDEILDPETPAPAAVATVPAQTSGWKIQLAASPSKSSAAAIVTKAMSKAPQLLAGTTGYTEPVAKGGTTLYRARIGGFDSKEAARKACTYLSKQDFKCLALSD